MPIKVFVGNLAPSVTSDSLIELFSSYGKVVEGDALGKFGFVHMENMDDAEAAIAALHGKEYEGIALKVEVSQGGGGKKQDRFAGGGGGGRGGGGGGRGGGGGGRPGAGGRGSGGDTKLFVGNLTPDITSDQLRELFTQYGDVTQADAKGKYGFVHMASHEDALAAMKHLTGHQIGSTKLNVELSGAKRPSGGGGPVKLFIGNLSESITSSDLRQLFERYGEVAECDTKGRFGFAHMASYDDAMAAMDGLCGYQLKGQTLNVEVSQGGQRGGNERGGGGGRGGYGGGYGGRGDYNGGGGGGGRGGYRDFGSGYGGRDDGPAKVFIGNLSDRTSKEDLKSLFQRYGRVKEADALGKFGFVHMWNMDEALRAIDELNGYNLNGIRINVELSMKGSGGGGPDRGRGGYSGGRRDAPYERPREPARDAMAVADYYARHGRLPPSDAPMERAAAPRDPYALYERDRLAAYDAYSRMAADPYAREREAYSRAALEPYRTAVDPYARPPPEAYASRRYEEYDRLTAARDPALASAALPAADRYTLTPEAAYAISRYADADRYRSAYTDTARSANGLNGATDPYTAAASSYTTPAAAGYSSSQLYSSYAR